jgi:deazaflavin-dependent oxidoreductase (nitroreductase family)
MQDHLDRYRSTDGEDGYLWDASVRGGTGMIPTLLLTTIGRKSGKALTLPLIFGRFGDDYVIVASKGGAQNHPAWYLNLVANPNVQLQVRADRFKASARTAVGDERKRLWERMVEMYSPYEHYQKKTEREIPIVVLQRL